jgi:hypothetical protein
MVFLIAYMKCCSDTFSGESALKTKQPATSNGEFSFEEAVRRPKHPAVRYQRRKRTIEERP